jgi:hypothetical protein
MGGVMKDGMGCVVWGGGFGERFCQAKRTPRYDPNLLWVRPVFGHRPDYGADESNLPLMP